MFQIPMTASFTPLKNPVGSPAGAAATECSAMMSATNARTKMILVDAMIEAVSLMMMN